ncbi:Hypothetical predicted protein, partial [Marmota monax]
PKEGSEGGDPEEGAEGREAALSFGPTPSSLENRTGSGRGNLSLCHPPNDARGPRLTRTRRCRRLPRKTPAAKGDALTPEPLHPSRGPLSSLVQIHPRDSVRSRLPPHRPPKRGGGAVLTVGAGVAPLGGGWGALGRHRGERCRRRRRRSPRSHS